MTMRCAMISCLRREYFEPEEAWFFFAKALPGVRGQAAPAAQRKGRERRIV